MAELALPTGDCVGVDVVKGGRVIGSYDAHKGHVEVENRAQARAIERAFGTRGRMTGFSHSPAAPSATCACDCGCRKEIFTAFGATCWRCRNGHERAAG